MTAAAGATVEAEGQAGAPALEVEGLCKSFRAVRALDEVALSLHYGRVTALLGDNGAGKSTLVKCIS
ncbi:MAG: ATP-binding cassette domain-containing protein, partial [Gemmatimonadetes bacterium]|nr:ATP-binding cassette domain-containing protein [Gemmatimonadota bacterium]